MDLCLTGKSILFPWRSPIDGPKNTFCGQSHYLYQPHDLSILVKKTYNTLVDQVYPSMKGKPRIFWSNLFGNLKVHVVQNLFVGEGGDASTELLDQRFKRDDNIIACPIHHHQY